MNFVRMIQLLKISYEDRFVSTFVNALRLGWVDIAIYLFYVNEQVASSSITPRWLNYLLIMGDILGKQKIHNCWSTITFENTNWGNFQGRQKIARQMNLCLETGSMSKIFRTPEWKGTEIISKLVNFDEQKFQKSICARFLFIKGCGFWNHLFEILHI